MGIFGGKKKSKSQAQSTQTSYNQAYQPILTAFQPLLKYANQGAADYKAFLGGDRRGFDKYLLNSSYDFDKERGEGMIGTQLASRGLRNSGAALKKLTEFNTGLNNRYAESYLDRLAQMMGVGTGAASALTGAGGYSTGQSTSSSSSKEKGGIGNIVGAALQSSAIMSDPRLKTDVIKVGEYEDGLGIYDFTYTYKPGRYRGVMADEVEKLRPWALGPEISGYRSVRYDLL